MQRGKPTGSRRDDRPERRSYPRRRTLGARILGSGRLLLAGGVLSSLAPQLARATSPFRFENRRENDRTWRLVPELSLLSTTENYDGGGAKAAVPSLTSYKKNQLDLTAVYGVNPKLSLFARLSVAAVSFDTTTLTASGSGLTEQGLGANYRVWESGGPGLRPRSIDLQGSIDIPLYDNVSSRASTPRQPLRGDGSLDLTAAAFGTFPLSQGLGQRFYLIAGLGLALRGNGYSKALPYQLQFVGLPEKTGLLYRAGFHGFKAMTSDIGGTTDYSPQSETSPGTVDARDAGGSNIVDALNSSYLQFRATLGYQWGVGDQIFATYLMPMSGTSTAAIKGFVLGAQFRFAGAKNPASNARSAGETAAAAKDAYDLEGRVTQANDRLNLIKVDKGQVDGVEKGQVFDIYRTGPDGLAADLVARGVVTGVSESETVVNLRQYKKEVWVQTGFIARRIAPKKP